MVYARPQERHNVCCAILSGKRGMTPIFVGGGAVREGVLWLLQGLLGVSVFGNADRGDTSAMSAWWSPALSARSMKFGAWNLVCARMTHRVCGHERETQLRHGGPPVEEARKEAHLQAERRHNLQTAMDSMCGHGKRLRPPGPQATHLDRTTFFRPHMTRPSTGSHVEYGFPASDTTSHRFTMHAVAATRGPRIVAGKNMHNEFRARSWFARG